MGKADGVNMRILISAYSCAPGRGSEPGLGWYMSRELAREHEVWVLTVSENRRDIEAELRDNPVDGLRFEYFDLPGSKRVVRSDPSVLVHYHLWQMYALRKARKLHARAKFDVVQHLTFMKYWAPSFMANLGIPFVWGPVGGGESGPRSFDYGMSPYGRRYERARRAARWIGERDPFVRKTASRSSLALATTEETARRLRWLGCRDVRIFEGVGLAEKTVRDLSSAPSPDESPKRFVSIGRLLDWKGFHLGIEAFARAKISDSEYWIVGDGPQRDRLQQLARDLQVSDRVQFLGQLSRPETIRRLASSRALVHPSLHDSGGSVCLEAMAAGRPVLCLDIGGPARLVADDAGIKVPVESSEEAISAMTVAMRRLTEDAPLAERLGTAGRRHVRDVYSWRERGRRMLGLYEEIVTTGASV